MQSNKRPKLLPTNTTKFFFEKMEPDFAGYLFSYLHPIEVLTSHTRVSKEWNRLCKCAPLWNRNLSIVFSVKPKLIESKDAKETKKNQVPLPPDKIGVDGKDGEIKYTDSPLNAWKAWYRVYRNIKIDPLSRRIDKNVANMWHLYKKYFSENAPEFIDTFNRGATDEEVKNLENALGPMPESLKQIYQVFNGQTLQLSNNHYMGLLGGYEVYSHKLSTRMLSLQEGLELSQNIHSQAPGFMKQTFLPIFMANTRGAQKIFFCDLEDGNVYILSNYHQRFHDTKFAHAAPKELGKNSVLMWLREHLKRLQEGMYAIRPIGNRGHDAICLFPQSGNKCYTEVTRGVEITGSSCFLIENAQMGHAYSIRMRILGPNEEGYVSKEQRGFDTCRLETRTWVIEDMDGKVNTVEGKGVIGFFPILNEGGWILNRISDPHRQMLRARGRGEIKEAFVYQSCSGGVGDKGSISGKLNFIGNNGATIEVKVPKIIFEIPKFKY